MNISRVVRAYDVGNFEKVLCEELHSSFESLPLEKACERGGYPKPDGDITVFKTWATDEVIQVTVTVTFTESVPTSCGGSVVTFSRAADCQIEIYRDGSGWEVEAVESERPEEF